MVVAQYGPNGFPEPEETEFLKRGKQRGALVKNGLEMLHLQAEKAWQIWQGIA